MKPSDVSLRQQHLLVRSTELRLTLRSNMQSLERPAAWADQLKAGFVWLVEHPQIPALGLTLLLILKPSRFLSWGGKAWWLWKTGRQLRRWRDGLMPTPERR